MNPATMDAVDHDLIAEPEFDALRIEVRTKAENEEEEEQQQQPRQESKKEEAAATATTSTKYPAKLHARRVAAELRAAGHDGSGLIYLPGEPARRFDDSDQGPAFRQRRYFYYVTGANFADCAATYDIATDRLILWIPRADPREVLWYGRVPAPADCRRRLDVDEVRYTAQLPGYLAETLPGGGGGGGSPGSRTRTLLVLHRDQVPAVPGLSAPMAPPAVDARVLRPAMNAARVIKSPYEVAAIRRANAISSAAHRAVAERFLGMASERHLEAVFEAACTVRGSREQAYPIIAAAGVNASTLHYGSNDGPLHGAQLVVLDAGCEWGCYASDITRTLPVGGRFATREAAAVHDLVAAMQEAALELVRPGALFRDAHLQAARVALRGLLQLGVLVGNDEEDQMWAAGTVAAFFPHGLGHHVGLEVHDVAGKGPLLGAAKRAPVTPVTLAELIEGPGASCAEDERRQLLREGMVITVEPGIYFCREYLEGYFLNDVRHSRYIDWTRLEAFYPVGGARIEDDVLVVEGGYENLTTAPKGRALLDVINGRAGKTA